MSLQRHRLPWSSYFIFHIVSDVLYDKVVKWLFDSKKLLILSYEEVTRKQTKAEKHHYIPRPLPKIEGWDIVYEDICERKPTQKIKVFLRNEG